MTSVLVKTGLDCVKTVVQHCEGGWLFSSSRSNQKQSTPTLTPCPEAAELETLLGYTCVCPYNYRSFWTLPLLFVKLIVASKRMPFTSHQLQSRFQESHSDTFKQVTKLTILFPTKVEMSSIHWYPPSVDINLAKNSILSFMPSQT